MDLDQNILIFEPESRTPGILVNRLKKMGFSQYQSAAPDISIESLGAITPDLAILDSSLDGRTCGLLVHKLKIVAPSVQVLICSDALHSMEKGYSCFEGIYNLTSDPAEDELLDNIKLALEYRREQQSLIEFPLIVGQSRSIIEIRKKILNVAGKDITVLVTGETGTGKELIARCIHYFSQRNRGPLVKVNCTSLPDELLESEVFGFQKGAFTDAYINKPGKIELADNGTLFIDEIGDLPLSLQVKFLQVLEDKIFSRLGGTDDRQLDIRVVVATNADLKEKVRDGKFRKDLYYRINVINIEVPPLRERKEDIPLLIYYFQNKYIFDFKKTFTEIPQGVIDHFLDYQWPGNVRELENVIKRGIALNDWNFIYDELRNEKDSKTSNLGHQTGENTPFNDWNDSKVNKLIEENGFLLKDISKIFISEVERNLITKSLEENMWHRKKTADSLKISYRTLLSRIDEFGLKR